MDSKLLEKESSNLGTRSSIDTYSLQAIPPYSNIISKMNKTNANLIDSPQFDFDQFVETYNFYPEQLYAKNGVNKWMPIHYATAEGKIDLIIFILDNSSPGGYNFQHFYLFSHLT